MAIPADIASHEFILATAPEKMAAYLQELLGQGLVAVMTGQKDPKVVGQWAKCLHAPQPAALRRLREAYYVVTLLLEREAPSTVRAWLVGLNPYLGDRVPALAIAEGDAVEVAHAARAFIAGAFN